MPDAPKKSAPPCPKCGGEGQLWICWDRDGFEYGHYWENCPECRGGWDPPAAEDEEEEDG